MKKIISIFLAFFFVCSSVFPFGAFDEAIEDSQEKREKQKEAETPKKSSPNSSASSDAEGSLIQLFAEIFAYVWIYNAYARYYPYPYSSSGTKYLTYKNLDGDSDYSDEAYSPLRAQRFSVETSFVWLKDLAVGNESTFDCMLYPLVGFYAKNLVLFDHIHNEGNMGNVHLGLIVPVFQSNFLSGYFKLGWSKWYNDVTPLLKDSAFFVGGELKSYPFKPLALKWLFGWQLLENDLFVFNSDLQAGIMLNRFEIFAGWKYMKAGTQNVASDCWKGFGTGVRVHF